MGFTLRPYQKEAVDAILASHEMPGNDVCVLPTGAGKSIVIAEVAHALNRPLLILQPSKEILAQNAQKLAQYVDPHEIGIYSASFQKRQIRTFTFATIQSIYRKPYLFDDFKDVIVDECHSINMKNIDSMFTSFFQSIGDPKVIGFTASPYRNTNGYHKYPGSDELYSRMTLKLINRMNTGRNKPPFWKRIIYNINCGALVDQGYLAPLKYYDRTIVEHEEIRINRSHSDFDLDLYTKQVEKERPAMIEKLEKAADFFKSTLVFCPTVAEAHALASHLPRQTAAVSGETPAKQRDAIIEGFKSGKIKLVFNVGVLTTGFDHPELDAILLYRPTKSLALYYQMLGRGVRIAPGKTHCSVVDFTGTVKKMGQVESIQLVKTGPGNHNWELYTQIPNGNGELVRKSWHNTCIHEMNLTEMKKWR